MFTAFKKMPEDAAAPWQGEDQPVGDVWPSLFAAKEANDARRHAEDAKVEAATTLRIAKTNALAVGGSLAAVLVGGALGTWVSPFAWGALGVVLLVALVIVAARGVRTYFAIGETIALAREQALQADHRAMSLAAEADKKITILPEPDEATPVTKTLEAHVA